ncbi:aldo/keto reductase [Tautonia plasticadhaerens]|uniref:L-glyceraldehyde 3-phosphate reductase n=1 Tax=Tautonia plasticadhaerens TaxID=2527974 RepID=A0A518HD73_9BACT|nr:aldo/keto reductase [Tautonia plasticadhaerens]QDV38626.1 L-glyceraldehyde 3-phosphate reductase [Tautonia plasticadhaerens]
MSADQTPRNDRIGIDRRTFLQAGAAAIAASGAGSAVASPMPAPRAAEPLPTRTLGKTGVELTMLDAGTWRAPGLDRLLRVLYSQGVRVIDTAKSYGSEPAIGRWLQQMPEVRKEIFLVTKDHPREPKDLLRSVDERLADLKTDYLDLYFVHGLGGTEVDWPKSKEFKEAAEALKKSGKVKFVGFSTHDATRAQQIMNAAEGGFVDAIMLQFTPWLERDDPLNRALDACFEKGIGLISMKQVAGTFSGWDQPGIDPLGEARDRVGVLAEKGFTPYQGLLQAIWSDERITTTCVSMRNTDQIRENVAAVLDYGASGPLTLSQIHQLRDACRSHGMTLCADCDGRCSRAAGTAAPLGDLTRYLTYHEHHGYKSEARRLYAELSDAQRDWRGADLLAARHACPNGLDFTKLLPKVDDLLA